MGEYATCKTTGRRVKIGTCENLYYLRADQAQHVIPESGSVDPLGDCAAIRFRFPFPSEDSTRPGAFEDHARSLRIDGLAPPTGEGWQHYGVQFVAQAGYVVSLPCPESGEQSHGLTVQRNGFRGAVFLCQQVWHEGILAAVLECACGMRWRLRTLEEARTLIDALEAMSIQDERERQPNAEYSFMVARRVALGYSPDYVLSLGFPGRTLTPETSA
jgi:hypothetical protein